jgi:hypothetical protein
MDELSEEAKSKQALVVARAWRVGGIKTAPSREQREHEARDDYTGSCGWRSGFFDHTWIANLFDPAWELEAMSPGLWPVRLARRFTLLDHIP